MSVHELSPKHVFSYENTQISIYHANKGFGLPKHSHNYSHVTLCSSGSCLVSLEGRSYIVNKESKPLNLPANEWHEIESLEDGTVFFNIFAVGKY